MIIYYVLSVRSSSMEIVTLSSPILTTGAPVGVVNMIVNVSISSSTIVSLLMTTSKVTTLPTPVPIPSVKVSFRDS